MSETLGVIFTGLIGLITALGGIQFQRGRRTEKAQNDLVSEFAHMKKEMRWLRRRDVAHTQHTFLMEQSMARAGIPIPERPSILDETGPMMAITAQSEEATE